MKRCVRILFPILLLIGSAGCAGLSSPGVSRLSQVPRITKGELLSQLARGNVNLIDVRRAEDWDASTLKIKGARREIPEDTPSWSKNFPKTAPIVLYCA